MREAVRSASGDPDGAFQSVLKVYEVRRTRRNGKRNLVINANARRLTRNSWPR